MILRLYHKFRSESTHNILTFEIARDFFTEDVSCIYFVFVADQYKIFSKI